MLSVKAWLTILTNLILKYNKLFCNFVNMYTHMNKQLSEYTDVELKAIAYDELQKAQIAQNNLRIINEELTRRNQANTPQQSTT